MSDTDADSQVVKIKEEVSVDLFTRNLILLVFLAVTVGYLLLTHGRFGDIDLSFALIGIIAAGLIVYAGSMIKLLLRGNLVRPISECAYILVPTTVMAALFAFRPIVFPDFLEAMTMPSLLLGAVLSAQNVQRARSGPGWLAIRAVSLVAAAMLVSALLSGLNMGMLGWTILVGAVLAASLSLLALFKEHSDIRLRTLGRSMARNSVFLAASILIILAVAYFGYFRPDLMRSDSGTVMMVEWIVIGVCILVLALLARRSMRTPAADGSVALEALVRGALKTKGDQTRVVEAMNKFVVDGSKAPVLVLLIAALREAGLSDGDVQKAVDRLANYHEDKIGLAWVWAYGNITAKRRRDRSRLMKETLEQATVAVEKRTVATLPMEKATE